MAGHLIVVLLASLDPRIAPLLERAAEEAAVFAQMSPKFVAQERMTQRGRVAPPRFRLRAGANAADAPVAGYRTTELISEFSFGSLKSAPGELRELRRVVSVNGKPVHTRLQARLELSEGMTGDTDRMNKQMLQDLEAHGLVGAATDLGQMLLLFTRAGLGQFEFQFLRRDQAGAEPVSVLAYRQLGEGGARLYQGRELTRVPMSGELWIAERNGLPLRITLDLPSREGKHAVIHRMSVDYAPHARGVLLPSSASYTRRQDATLMVETLSSYTDYKMFAADAEIKFAAEEGDARQ